MSKPQRHVFVCEQRANVVLYREAVMCCGVTPADVEEVFTSHFERGQPVACAVAPEAVR